MSAQHTPTPSYWQAPMSEADARRWRGDAFDKAVAAGEGYCACRMAGAWDANQPDDYGFYWRARMTAEVAQVGDGSGAALAKAGVA